MKSDKNHRDVILVRSDNKSVSFGVVMSVLLDCVWGEGDTRQMLGLGGSAGLLTP